MNQNLNRIVRETASASGELRVEPTLETPVASPITAQPNVPVQPTPVRPQPMPQQMQQEPQRAARATAPQPLRQAATPPVVPNTTARVKPVQQSVQQNAAPAQAMTAQQKPAPQVAPAAAPPVQPNLDFISSQRGTGEFKKAKRHTYLVKSLKLLLPLVGVAVIGIFAGAMIFRPGVPEISIESTSLSDGKLVMENPDLKGFDGQKRPYTLTAERAIQDPAKPGQIELDAIDARVAVEEGNFANIIAGNGFYDSDAKTLKLGGNVNVITDDGMQIDMQDADMDIDKGILKSQNPVSVKTSGADISADTLLVEDNGDRIVFEKRVKLTLRPNQLPKQNVAEAQKPNQ